MPFAKELIINPQDITSALHITTCRQVYLFSKKLATGPVIKRTSSIREKLQTKENDYIHTFVYKCIYYEVIYIRNGLAYPLEELFQLRLILPKP